jgi:hypothetical protein
MIYLKHGVPEKPIVLKSKNYLLARTEERVQQGVDDDREVKYNVKEGTEHGDAKEKV